MKSRYFFVILLSCMLLTADGFASDKNNRLATSPVQFSFSGVVIDKTSNEELAGVSIYIPELDQKIYSDVNGKFRVSGLQPGNYKVKVSCISYRDHEMSIRVVKSQNDDLKISMSPIEP